MEVAYKDNYSLHHISKCILIIHLHLLRKLKGLFGPMLPQEARQTEIWEGPRFPNMPVAIWAHGNVVLVFIPSTFQKLMKTLPWTGLYYLFALSLPHLIGLTLFKWIQYFISYVKENRLKLQEYEPGSHRGYTARGHRNYMPRGPRKYTPWDHQSQPLAPNFCSHSAKSVPDRDNTKCTTDRYL